MFPVIIASIESPEDRDIMFDFYTRYCGLLYSEVKKYVNKIEDVEDIVYEAFAKIIDKMDVFRELQPPQRIQYALTTARNLSFGMLKREKRFTFVSIDAEDYEVLLDEGESLDSTVQRNMVINQLRKIWGSLDTDDRMLLEQKYILEWKDSEIALQLGIQPASVRMRLTRTKRRLMEILKEHSVSLADWE